MKKLYYVTSTKQGTPRPRQTKTRGNVFDATVRVYKADYTPYAKKFSGYKTKKELKDAITEFFSTECEYIKSLPEIKESVEKSDPLIGDLHQAYIKALMNQNKESVIYGKQLIFNQFILPYYKDKPVSCLTKQELYRWQDDIWNKKNPRSGNYFAYKYLSNIRTTFSGMLTWGETRYGFINNFRNVEKPKRRAPKTKMAFWTKEEWEKFISVVDDPMWHALFATLFYTGRRRGEVLALSPENVYTDSIFFGANLTNRTLDGSSYKVTSTKADKDYSTPICPSLRKELENYAPTSGKFYFGGDKPVSFSTLARQMDKYIKSAKVKRISPHGLRHSFVSMCVHLGASVYVIADLIGDTVEQVLRTYGHLYEEDKLKIIEKIG